MITVIGAGIAGLSFAKALEGGNVVILEQDSRIGGKAATYKINTPHGVFTFDIGGHWFHRRHHPEVLPLLGGLRLQEHVRYAFVHLDGTKIPFPVQQHYASLGDKELVRRIDDELQSIRSSMPSAFRNYDDMLRKSYGRTLYEKFFKPYNSKMYGINDLQEIRLGGYEGVRNVRLDKSTQGYNPTFLYPPGDTGAIGIPLALGEGLPIQHTVKVQSIRLDNRSMTAGGKKSHWDRIVSTMPLRELVDIIEDAGPAIKEAARELKASRGMILNLGIRKKPANSGISWMYIPDMKYRFYRIGFYSNVEPALAPEGFDAVYVECSPLFFSDENEARALLPHIADDLAELGIIDSPEDIVVSDAVYLPLNYCLPAPETTSLIRSYLERHGIYSIGRYGSWHWSSQHEDMKQAMDLARRIEKDDSRNGLRQR
jgi:protoporphyrinogen oxidase